LVADDCLANGRSGEATSFVRRRKLRWAGAVTIMACDRERRWRRSAWEKKLSTRKCAPLRRQRFHEKTEEYRWSAERFALEEKNFTDMCEAMARVGNAELLVGGAAGVL